MTTRRLIAVGGGVMTFAVCAVLPHLFPLTLVRLTLLGAALGAVVESDLFERRIPNRIVVPAAFACAAMWAASGIALFALADGLVLVLELAIEKKTTSASCPWNLSTVPIRAPAGRHSRKQRT
jgi:hypothetical protein